MGSATPQPVGVYADARSCLGNTQTRMVDSGASKKMSLDDVLNQSSSTDLRVVSTE
jgi:hypothetical protein